MRSARAAASGSANCVSTSSASCSPLTMVEVTEKASGEAVYVSSCSAVVGVVVIGVSFGWFMRRYGCITEHLNVLYFPRGNLRPRRVQPALPQSDPARPDRRPLDGADRRCARRRRADALLGASQ